jgi:prepilin-type N-terminal cleavage/methylation domain-containing protein
MKICGSEKGFTIVETMVAIAILAVGMLGVGTLLLVSLTSDKYGGRTRRAESLALQKIEDLKQQNTILTPLTSGSTADAVFAYRWSVSNYQWLDTKQNSGLQQLDVTVGWPVGGSCTSSTPEQCTNRFSVTTYFQPLTK